MNSTDEDSDIELENLDKPIFRKILRGQVQKEAGVVITPNSEVVCKNCEKSSFQFLEKEMATGKKRMLSLV